MHTAWQINKVENLISHLLQNMQDLLIEMSKLQSHELPDVLIVNGLNELVELKPVNHFHNPYSTVIFPRIMSLLGMKKSNFYRCFGN